MKIQEIAQIIINSIKQGGTIFVCGNGGSATMSSHFVGELVGKYKHDRRALPAISLTDNSAVITAIANDFSYDHVFVRQLQALAKKGDVLVTLSTSGKSQNVLKAIEWANANEMIVVDLERIGNDTAEIQEGHLFTIHKVSELVEKAFLK